MIRVLIVEDEPPIARAVVRLIEELSPSFKVIGCETNGQDALEHMRRAQVDLVFTDIRMPVMDGLELLKTLRTDWPDCLAVILSGHQDFAYTQAALRLGAFDYLLKPISKGKLRELLVRLEDAFARNLLQDVVASWRAGGKTPAAGFSLSKGLSYGLVLAVAGHWPAIPDDALSPGSAFWQRHDPYLLIGGLLDKPSSAVVFVGRAAAERVFLLENVPPGKAFALAEGMFDRVTQLSALPKTLCVMPGPLDFEGIGAGIQTIRKRVFTQIGLCRSSLLYEPEPAQRLGSAPPSLPSEALAEALFGSDEKQIEAAVEAVVDAAVSSSMTQAAFEHLLSCVVYDRRLSLRMKPLREDISEAILCAASPAGLKSDLSQIFKQYALGEGKIEQKSLIDQVEQYLSAHYAEDISSELLSSKFGFVPSYLSKVFRRQAGVSPTEYLAKLRIEKAKELLETRPGLLVREAAALVGIKDPYYFSKLFKKSTGLWPSQYQENALSDIKF
ncbi:MAG: response regulator [Clostridiales bacterium]|nr:response regulator [Clostridiales bacterium]